MMPLTFLYCEEESDVKSRGAKAAEEFCDYFEDHSKSYCFDKLKDKYGSNVSDDFIKAFNEAQDCNAIMYRESV
jgi:hypothetical protein